MLWSFLTKSLITMLMLKNEAMLDSRLTLKNEAMLNNNANA